MMTKLGEYADSEIGNYCDTFVEVANSLPPEPVC